MRYLVLLFSLLLSAASAQTIEQKTPVASAGASNFGQLASGTNTTMAAVCASGCSISFTTGWIAMPGYASASLPTCNGAAKGQLAYTTDNTAALVFCNGSSWVGSGGTTFTITPTGCTPSATAGSATAGSITLASGPCTSIIITFNGSVGMTAPNGWHCNVGDKTTQNAGTWIPQWGESASNTTTATIPVPAAAGATDVLTFACTPY